MEPRVNIAVFDVLAGRACQRSELLPARSWSLGTPKSGSRTSSPCEREPQTSTVTMSFATWRVSSDWSPSAFRARPILTARPRSCRSWGRSRQRPTTLERTRRGPTMRPPLASLLFGGGKDVKQIEQWLGHADPRFTLRTYVHRLDDGLGTADFLMPILRGEPLARFVPKIGRSCARAVPARRAA
jgi:hypothetical protein